MLMGKYSNGMHVTEWQKFINTKGLTYDVIPDLLKSNWKKVMLHTT